MGSLSDAFSGARRVIVDSWSWLNFKPIYSDHARGMPNRRAFPEANATWVPPDHERRLAAYTMLGAYDNNQTGEITAILDGRTARERREFGDPSMFVDTLVAHVLGRDQTITVHGADQVAGTDTTGTSQAIAERVQTMLRDWAEAELLPMRMQQCERKAVSLGDGVYRLAWEPGKRRPTVRVTDPGFYYPVIGEDDDDGEYPRRVHFAWELPADKARGTKARLRRITYELDWIRPATVTGLDETGRRAVRAMPTPNAPADDPDSPAGPVLTEGDSLDPASGMISRLYAWNSEPSFVTCYLTDATWLLEDLTGQDVDALPLEKAAFATRADGEVLDHLDLLLDFIPVVHVPNTVPPAEEHWGQSSLAKILQVFDELASSDTDAARASATTGLPMVAISGVAPNSRRTQEVGPGVMFELGENGKMTAIDTSPALKELRDHRHDLQDRAANVARLPAVALGTMDPSKVPSGYALQLSLGPLDSLIGGMRLARDHKYALLLKFAQRLFIAGQHPDWAGVEPLPARMVFGPYTPTDKAAILEQVSTAFQSGVLSLETAVRMLTDAGWPIEDAEQEIQQIQARRFTDAVALADATGSTEAVAKFLGIAITPDPTPPAPNFPPTGQGNEPDPDDNDEPEARGSGGNE
ncbi:hypothetical protein [Streptomyces anulatus]|uniref:hypothetical protein n=1 Tax=Streptomyces anulatus TaxID=1892 RepID=UPI002F916A62